MHHPISQERVDFLRARIAVLHDMNLELSNSYSKWPQSSSQNKQKTLETIQAEKLQCLVEMEVLTRHLNLKET